MSQGPKIEIIFGIRLKRPQNLQKFNVNGVYFYVSAAKLFGFYDFMLRQNANFRSFV